MKKTATLLFAIVLASCAAPKPDIVAEAPQNKTQATAPANPETTPVALTESDPKLPVMRNTGLRLPDMLKLPQDEQLRSAPDTPENGKATVIARPPEE